MIKVVLICFLLSNILFAMDFDFLKVEKITLDSSKEYNNDYKKATGKGIIEYKYVGIPPLEYNDKNGKFEFNKQDIKMGFFIGFHAQYKGDIKKGKRDGFGVLESKLRLKYKGTWKNDKFHGKGILTQDRSDFRYEGDFVDGKKQGMGSISYYLSIYVNKDKTKYSFTYDENNFSDRISYKLNYIGKFKDDLPYDKAECYLVDDKYQKQKCVFENGVLKSKIKLPK